MRRKISLAIDARPLTRGKGGIQRYLERVLAYICDSKEFDITLYCDQPIKDDELLQRNNITVKNLPNSFISRYLWHVYCCLWSYKDKPDLYWSPRHHLPLLLPKSTKKLVTIHDLVWSRVPETLPKSKLLAERILMPLAVRSADHIICVSKTTKRQLIEKFSASKNKCEVILNGFDTQLSPKTEAHRQSNVYISVGTLEPRKNYETLIQEFDRYLDLGGSKQLIIIGKKGWSYKTIYQTLDKIRNKGKIKIVCDVDDDALDQFYRTSAGFISTSLDEGFGLPAIEAHARGCSLLLSNISIYQELFPFAKTWLDLSSKEGIGHQIFDSEQNDFHYSPASLGEHHSWEECARKHLALFLNASKKLPKR